MGNKQDDAAFQALIPILPSYHRCSSCGLGSGATFELHAKAEVSHLNYAESMDYKFVSVT